MSSPRPGYSYVYVGDDWRRASDEDWDTEVLGTEDVLRPAIYAGQRRIDGAPVNVWFVSWSGEPPMYYAQTPTLQANQIDQTTALYALGGLAVALGILWWTRRRKPAPTPQPPLRRVMLLPRQQLVQPFAPTVTFVPRRS